VLGVAACRPGRLYSAQNGQADRSWRRARDVRCLYVDVSRDARPLAIRTPFEGAPCPFEGLVAEEDEGKSHSSMKYTGLSAQGRAASAQG
jgi:hypothetical protein